ncbi:MAG TPA: trypsin-like peptidase domain-containing protein [Beijerinckiaceae bacterium]|jgi:2-alkenal reductase
MQDRFTRLALILALVLFAAYVGEPYVERFFYSAQGPRTVASRGDLAAAERTNIELFQRVSPSVVHVYAQAGRRNLNEVQDDDEGTGGGGVQTGTGFIWDAAGHIVTNNHVVQGAQQMSIRLSTGETVTASVVGTAPNYDLAVLRLGRAQNPPPPIAIGTSSDLKVGQFTFAIGNPFGLDQTLTTGVISALQRRLPTSEGREIADAIQTDASINPGNSGGPLLDSAGRLIGVNTAIYSPSGASAGIGFAIPVDVVNRVVPELIRTGRLPSPGIGIIAAQEAAAARVGIEGVVVLRTLPNSPAARAGLQGVDTRTGEIGDIIVGVNGRAVRRLSELTAELERAGIGQAVELAVDRGGRAVTVRVDVADVGARR